MGNWYVIKSKPKGERKALREIQKLGIEAYLPEYQIERLNRRLRIRKVSTLCHFPRYLFALLEPRDFGAIRDCTGVADVLPGFPQDPQPVPAGDVLALRDAQARHLFDDTDQARRLRGETTQNTLKAMKKRLKNKRVRVTGGAFYGFPAKVEAVKAIDRLRVIIEIFGRDTPVDLDIDQVEEMAA